MLFAIPFPEIDPIIFQIGPFALRWYALAYIAGILLAWQYMRWMAVHPPMHAAHRDVDDFIVWATLGIVIGGRLGYVLFYNFDFYLSNPGAILQVWKGGMSFHGGLLGVVVATYLFVRKRGLDVLPFADLIACAAPIGLFLGRLANFINSELYGRVTDVPWAMVFPNGGAASRHPSQLYEAGLEGLVLFAILFILWRQESVRRRPGMLMGVFLIGYWAARSFVELFRQPDVQIGFMSGGTTMGQWLSFPMLLLGLFLLVRARRPVEK